MDNGLRILTVVFSKTWGGLEMVACEITTKFKDLGHDIFMISPSGSRIEHLCEAKGLRHIAISPIMKYLDLFTAWKLAKIIRGNTIDIIHVYISKDLSTAALAILFARRGKLVFSQHMDSHYPKKDVFHRWVFSKVNMITTVTQSVRQHVLEYTSASYGDVVCIYNGINLDKFNPAHKKCNREDYGIPENSLVVGLVGRIDRLKKQDLLVEAAPSVIRKFPQTHFIIVGEESIGMTGEGFKAELIQMVEQKNLSAHFRFIDFTQNVQDVTSLFDVALLTTPKETFGIVLIEAMAMGIPVIGTNAGGVPEIIDDGIDGLLFEPNNALQLGEKIITLLVDKERRHKMGQEGIRKVHATFDLKKKIVEYERLFYSLTGPDFT